VETKYLFTSERLGFRNWKDEDLPPMAVICADKEVMEFFPKTLSILETKEFIDRMKLQFKKTGYCYFAVEEMKTETFIGFIGLNYKDFKSDFTPCVDVGWRISKNYWNKGYATEGAKSCLEYAKNKLKLKKVFSIAPAINIKSEKLMQKIGMQKEKEFIFDLLEDNDRLRNCVLYKIDL